MLGLSDHFLGFNCDLVGYFHPGIAAVIVGKTHPKRFGMGLSFNGRQMMKEWTKSLANIRILSPEDRITLELSLYVVTGHAT